MYESGGMPTVEPVGTTGMRAPVFGFTTETGRVSDFLALSKRLWALAIILFISCSSPPAEEFGFNFVGVPTVGLPSLLPPVIAVPVPAPTPSLPITRVPAGLIHLTGLGLPKYELAP